MRSNFLLWIWTYFKHKHDGFQSKLLQFHHCLDQRHWSLKSQCHYHHFNRSRFSRRQRRRRPLRKLRIKTSQWRVQQFRFSPQLKQPNRRNVHRLLIGLSRRRLCRLQISQLGPHSGYLYPRRSST
jgi:hypothetical protein